MLRVLICGDRRWLSIETIRQVLERLQRNIGISHVIVGELYGAEVLGRIAAEGLGIRSVRFPPDWERYGKEARRLSNRQMFTEGKPDCVIAFHKNLQSSHGTKSIVRIAEERLIPWWCFDQGAHKLAEFIVKVRHEYGERNKTVAKA